MEIQALCLEDIPNEDVEIPDGIKKTGVETRAPRQPRPSLENKYQLNVDFINGQEAFLRNRNTKL